MEKNNDLGLWTLIDIETTGADPSGDDIIDVGFLQFDGLKLVRKYQSLVHTDIKLSKFIEKLTGIDQRMVKHAPSLETVMTEVTSLYSNALIAHNSAFEESFLSRYFRELDGEDTEGLGKETYNDSLFYLALLFPQLESLKLERFIIDFGLSDGEMHRGYEDSLDLLKVMLVATYVVHEEPKHDEFLRSVLEKYNFEDFWFKNFYYLSQGDLLLISEQVEFDLLAHVEIAKNFFKINVRPVSVEPVRISHDFNGSNISAIFKDEAHIRKILPQYSFRQSQLDLALKVGQCFKNGIHSLVQAPTGTGKTLGYLIPSALYALSGEQNEEVDFVQNSVLIATGTKALQTQAMEKDLPRLRQILGLREDDFKVTRLIGCGNHLCQTLFMQQLKGSEHLFKLLPFEESFAYAFMEAVFYYNDHVDYNHKITFENLPFVIRMKNAVLRNLLNEISADFRSCTGKKCPYAVQCSYQEGIAEAKNSNIIIGNHSLMFSWPKAFPRPRCIVVDEAHKLENEATSANTPGFDDETLSGIIKNLHNGNVMGSLYHLIEKDLDIDNSIDRINGLKEASQKAFELLTDVQKTLYDCNSTFFRQSANYTDVFWNEVPMLYPEKGLNDLEHSIYNSLDRIKNVLDDFESNLAPYVERWDMKNVFEDGMLLAYTRFKTFDDQLVDCATSLDILLTQKEGYTHSLAFHEMHGFKVQSAPIDIGRTIHDSLLETSDAVVFTSATLGNAQGDQGTRGIEWALGYTYLEPERRFRTGFYLPAVYDYANKAQVHVCDDTPSIYDRNFVPFVLTPILDMVGRIGGKSLLLFSAKSRFEIAREMILEKFDGVLPVFIQGMGSNVVDDFKEQGGILLGMESFGEGIDVPGDALQFVFVDKIPDLRRELVIDDRRAFYDENFGNEFVDYFLSHRTSSLHQKLGRLLRATEDFGGAIVVDSRIKKWKARTMNSFFKLMEPYLIKRSTLHEAIESVEQFINCNTKK